MHIQIASLTTLLATLAAAQIPIHTNVGCGGTVELDFTTIIGSCPDSAVASATELPRALSFSSLTLPSLTLAPLSLPSITQPGNSGIVIGTRTFAASAGAGAGSGAGAGAAGITSTGGAPKATALGLVAAGFGGAAAVLAL